jgi:hypothetical protein
MCKGWPHGPSSTAKLLPSFHTCTACGLGSSLLLLSGAQVFAAQGRTSPVRDAAAVC